jgi:hypothetical protein
MGTQPPKSNLTSSVKQLNFRRTADNCTNLTTHRLIRLFRLFRGPENTAQLSADTRKASYHETPGRVPRDE